MATSKKKRTRRGGKPNQEALAKKEIQVQIVEGLTVDLAKRIIEAIPQSPSNRVACASVGISYRALKAWVVAGTMADAPPELQMFAAEVLKTESAAAQELFREIRQSAMMGGAGIQALVQLLKMRCTHLGEDEDLVSHAEANEHLPARRSALLRRPPPAMVEDLQGAGWYRLTPEEREKLGKE